MQNSKTQYGHELACWEMKRHPSQDRPKVAVSACLLGLEVRFDGGHKQSRLVKDLLGQVCELIPICPEVGIGLPIPREPIRLIKTDRSEIAVRGSRRPELDVTAALDEFAASRESQLQQLSGYIFMQKSPSCGLYRVKLYNEQGQPLLEKAAGRYAAAVVERFPHLPVEEAGRLTDPVLFENFMTRVFTDFDWRQQIAEGLTAQALLDFHSRHKLLIMAHAPRLMGEMGRLLASLNGAEVAEVAVQYRQLLAQALTQRTTRKSHGNVLLYMARFLKAWLSPVLKQEWERLVNQYRDGQVPLVVPITLVRHYANQHPDSFLARQVYLQPHPPSLGLRNAI